jgi:microcystin-dependent protein
MPLSRLENFLKNIQGFIIYVDPNEIDATDDITNQGNSKARPFKTIQRALIEAARFSYQAGVDNDKFDQTTIVIAPGTHYIDNRPGYRIDTSGNVTDVNGTTQSIAELTLSSNFDIQDATNDLYKFNSIHGGVIIPRGVSITSIDLRKTKIRPKYVPDPANVEIERSSVFRLTGGCYMYGFTFFDADINDNIFKDHTGNTYAPRFSHHKLSCFEYADGTNNFGSSGNTDLGMYYHKLTLAYGTSSGRALPDYPANDDFEKKVDESRIVGSLSQTGAIAISDIYSGLTPTDSTATSVVTVVTSTDHGVQTGTPVRITGVNNSEYDGSFIAAQILNSTTFTYAVATAPTSTATPDLSGLTPEVNVESDSTSSASPYIYNCSLRSVYGQCGMLADGSKATGFKSMVVAQFTGIGLQKDNNAFVRYNKTSGIYEDQATLGSSVNLYSDSEARYIPDYANFHIKVTNNSYIQAVSIFAIGYAEQFVSEDGGDLSITNSNSNFGAKSLVSKGFRDDAFAKDDRGYITHIIPPRNNTTANTNLTYLTADVAVTAGLSTDTKIYFYDYKNQDTPPPRSVSGYIIGAKVDDTVSVSIASSIQTAMILMPTPGTDPDDRVSAIKSHVVGRAAGINSITSNTFTLQNNHKFLNGESVRIISANGSLPDGIESNKIYYAITDGLSANQIQIANTENGAIAGTEITNLNNLGGELTIESRVSDKIPGGIGHPIQYDTNGWYINVDVRNSLHAAIVANEAAITPKTSNLTLTRTPDNRNAEDKTYRFRYVIPQEATDAVPPIPGFVIQESGTVIDDTIYQNDNTDITDITQLRTNTSIVNASWVANSGIVTTQYPHNLLNDQHIRIKRLKSTNNTTGTFNAGFNRDFRITEIIDSRTFKVGLNTDPGGITTVASSRPYTYEDRTVVGSGRTFAPYFERMQYGPAYQVFESKTIQKFIPSVQDGIYQVTVAGHLAAPPLSPFATSTKFLPQNFDYRIPSIDKDNPVDDPTTATSYAVRDPEGQVDINNVRNSLTRESLDNFIAKSHVGLGITSVTVSGGQASVITDVEHGFNGISSVTSPTGGSNLGLDNATEQTYYNIDLTGGSGKGATAKVVVGTSNTVTEVILINPGSGYAVSDTLTLRGLPFFGSPSDCTVDVQAINNNVGDVVEIVGVSSSNYNGLHRITSVEDHKTFKYTTTAEDSSSGGTVRHVGTATTVISISHDPTSGIATVQFARDLGLQSGNRVVLSGATGFATVYNGDKYIVQRIGYGSSLSVEIGITTNAPAITGLITAYGAGLGARRGFSTRGNERIGERQLTVYAGKETTLTTGITTTSTSISLHNTDMFRRGDYIQIGSEILRIKDSDIADVLRGVFGTNATSHEANELVKAVRVLPVELRRNSSLRSSGHTFEYTGFGPGNYSTGIPQNQARQLTESEINISQAHQYNGGSVAFTGMNNDGIFYIGKRKFDSQGRPISQEAEIAITAEEDTNNLNVDTITVNSSLISNLDSDFVDINLKGNREGGTAASIGENVYVGIGTTTPDDTDSTDHVLFATGWNNGGYAGWIRTRETSSKWKRFGKISLESDADNFVFDKVGVGTESFTNNDAFHVTGETRLSGNIHHTGVSTHVGNVQVSSGSSFIGAGTIPVGGIIMWSGTIANIPTGWALCDGSGITPDLRERFIVGAGDDSGAGETFNATTGATSGRYAVGDTGGSTAHQLTTAEMPSHSHNFFNIDSSAAAGNSGVRVNAGSGQGQSTTSAGSNNFHENRPKYFALAFIMRTA